jgi:dUTPase
MRDHGNIVYLQTGLVVQPPSGYYFELHVRSSFHGTGWTLANNVGIIDPEYRGEIRMAIVRLYPEAELPKLPK